MNNKKRRKPTLFFRLSHSILLKPLQQTMTCKQRTYKNRKKIKPLFQAAMREDAPTRLIQPIIKNEI